MHLNKHFQEITVLKDFFECKWLMLFGIKVLSKQQLHQRVVLLCVSVSIFQQRQTIDEQP